MKTQSGASQVRGLQAVSQRCHSNERSDGEPLPAPLLLRLHSSASDILSAVGFPRFARNHKPYFLLRAIVSSICVCLFLTAAPCNACNVFPDQIHVSFGGPGRPQPSPSATASPRRDLSHDEARGGHTLRKHVGRTNAELQERLQREPNIGAASTYTDRGTAEAVVGSALVLHQDRISRWLNRTRGRHPNLVLDYNASQPVGRTLNRGESQAEPCSHALVVLKFDGHGEYHVLTSYPECR